MLAILKYDALLTITETTYIGSTTISLSRRFDRHLSDIKAIKSHIANQHKKLKISNAIKHYQ